MKALKIYGAKSCVLCRKAWAPNKIEQATVNGVSGLWVCKRCSSRIAARSVGPGGRASWT